MTIRIILLKLSFGERQNPPHSPICPPRRLLLDTHSPRGHENAKRRETGGTEAKKESSSVKCRFLRAHSSDKGGAIYGTNGQDKAKLVRVGVRRGGARRAWMRTPLCWCERPARGRHLPAGWGCPVLTLLSSLSPISDWPTAFRTPPTSPSPPLLCLPVPVSPHPCPVSLPPCLRVVLERLSTLTDKMREFK
ncbi:hypothetical protein E2C01_034590 [Portunus trituberculatus]|uniref:Uncharacterized protein n=1 Tax=Portunus trituberculatus TaxID=210409 RepID=A0A5B7F0Z8_PORTR|nr:hypothetical protein [Portunus trituberculatus]